MDKNVKLGVWGLICIWFGSFVVGVAKIRSCPNLDMF